MKSALGDSIILTLKCLESNKNSILNIEHGESNISETFKICNPYIRKEAMLETNELNVNLRNFIRNDRRNTEVEEGKW